MMYGVSGFVAHEDIEPSREWQQTIEVALMSMHAVVALMTPEFHESRWIDQEVGWGFGRGVLVLPARLGVDPYGFAGKVQAVTGHIDHPKPLAKSITLALLGNSRTHGEMRRALVHAFARSDCWATAKLLAEIVTTISAFTVDEKAVLLRAVKDNGQVRGARGVAESIREAFGVDGALEGTVADSSIPF